MTKEIKNGRVKIGESEHSTLYAMRTDLIKYGVQVYDMGHYGMSNSLALAYEFAKAAMASPIKRSPEDLAAYCIALSERMFDLGKEKGWIVPLDMDAMEMLEDFDAGSDFAGIAPGRK